MIPEFLIAMGLTFSPTDGLCEPSDDPTAEAAPDWNVLIPVAERPRLATLMTTDEVADLDEWGAVERYVAADSVAVLVLDIGDPVSATTSVIVTTYTPDGTFRDMTRIGSRGSENITPFLDVRDNHGESVAFIAREKPVDLKFVMSPEGRVMLETVEVTEVDAWNAELAENETYRLTELHRSYVFDPDGRIRLVESRPVPTDRDAFARRFRVTLAD